MGVLVNTSAGPLDENQLAVFAPGQTPPASAFGGFMEYPAITGNEPGYIDDFSSLGDVYVGSPGQMQSIPYQSSNTWANIAQFAASIGGTVSGVYNAIANGLPYTPTGAIAPKGTLSAVPAAGRNEGLLLIGGAILILFLLLRK